MEHDLRLMDIHRRAHLVHNQIEAAQRILRESGAGDPSIVLANGSPYLELLQQLYAEEFPLAKVASTSDLIIHAEGPSTSEGEPQLSVVNWLFSGIGKQIKNLAKSVLDLSIHDERDAMKALDIRLTGMAPGSIYAGFAIHSLRPAPLLGTADDDAITTVRDAVTSLALVPEYVSANFVSDALAEVMPDPALRDMALMAAFNLAPTGKNGINTIELTSPARKTRVSTLDVRDRGILRETVTKRPMSSTHQRQGAFIGELRGIDLDKLRVDLRNVGNGIGTLRCVLPLTLDKARDVLGKKVKVTGKYESGPNGKPRLVLVEKIEVVGNGELDI